MRYYKSKQSGNVRGKIELDTILTVEASSQDSFNKKNCFGFTITTARRVINLFARTSIERSFWMDGLNKRIAEMISRQKRVSFKHIHFLTMPQIKPHQDMKVPTGTKKKMITSRSKSESELIPEDKEMMKFRPKSVAFALADVTKAEMFEPTSEEDTTQRKRDSPPKPKEEIQVVEKSHPKEDPEMLIQRIKDLQRKCEDQHSQIAALASLVEKPNPSVKPSANQRRSQKITNSERKGKFQEEINQFVGIGMWLEQKKKTDLASEVNELAEKLQQALFLLEDEHKKVQYLESSRQELMEQLKQLTEEKERLKALVKATY